MVLVLGDEPEEKNLHKASRGGYRGTSKSMDLDFFKCALLNAHRPTTSIPDSRYFYFLLSRRRFCALDQKSRGSVLCVVASSQVEVGDTRRIEH